MPDPAPPPVYRCPRCGARSWHPKDAEHRYCAQCHAFEGEELLKDNLTPDGPAEYECRDCGRHVVAFGFNTQIERCNSCAWIRANVPPEHQPDARDRLGVPLVTSGNTDL